MKKIYLILLTSVIFSGCGDWLDVSSDSIVKTSDLFKDEEGFHSAVAGVYNDMRSVDLYGKQTLTYVPELLARNWNLPKSR